MAAPTNLSELRDILQGVVSLEAPRRVEALKLAAEWYQKVIPFFRKSFTPADETALQRALKAYALGAGGTTIDEQETGLRTALRMFEKSFSRPLNSIADPPTIGSAYEALDAERKKLEAEKLAAELRTADELTAMRFAFGASGLKFFVDPLQSAARNIDDDKTIRFSPEHLKKGRLPSYAGVLPVVLREIPAVLKALSLEKDSQGNTLLNYSKMGEKVEPMIRLVLNWLEGKPQVEPDPVLTGTSPAPAATRPTPPPPPPPRPSPRPSPSPRTSQNPYRGIKGQIFEALLQHQGTRVHINAIVAGLGAKDPRRMVGHIKDDGFRTGRWSLQMSRAGWIDFSVS